VKSTASNLSRRFLLSSMAALPALVGVLHSTPVLAQSDPLPSWNEGATKKSITDFVARVTTQGTDFVPVDQRIATFDNDGTLWIEQPMYVQLAFILDRVKTLAPQNPSWKTKQPFKAVLDGDMRALAASGERGLVQLMAVTHAGMISEEFAKIVSDWLASARDHRFKRPYTELVYTPMLELLASRAPYCAGAVVVSGE
jgi:haloacid dehalogenase-like hydrolase